jgi:hypothetical protein
MTEALQLNFKITAMFVSFRTEPRLVGTKQVKARCIICFWEDRRVGL